MSKAAPTSCPEFLYAPAPLSEFDLLVVDDGPAGAEVRAVRQGGTDVRVLARGREAPGDR
ncbi:hypothetical protein [Streptomyces sp. NPDC003006]